jgi:ribosomal protein L29
MKTKDFKKNISGKSAKELGAMLSEKKLALRTFRFGVAGSNARNVKEGNALKKQIARVSTALSALK